MSCGVVGAGELAAMIAGDEVSSAEVVEAHLARIEAVNPPLNAVTEVLADERPDGGGRRRPGVARTATPLGRCTACRSRSSRTSTSSARRPTGDCRRSPTPCRPVDSPVVERMKRRRRHPDRPHELS